MLRQNATSFKLVGLLSILVLTCASLCSAKSPASVTAPSWTPLKNQPNFSAAQPLLLTDGTVICQEVLTRNWYRLTPDHHGNYIDGTWTQLASLPAGYAPLYYASAVLADGRVVILGGEYNAEDNGGQAVWTNKGAIYDPAANVWSALAAPPNWMNVGDAQSIVLPNKRWMVGNPFGNDSASLDPRTLLWTELGSNGEADGDDEEGWNLLPDGTVLTVDATDLFHSERYFPSSDTWQSAGSTVVSLADFSMSDEVGPAVLRPNGTVFYAGACLSDGQGNCLYPGHTAIYKPSAKGSSAGSWTPGPDFPNGLDIADGPAAILPNGNVLMMASPGIYQVGAVFFEFDGKELNEVPSTPHAPQDSSCYCNMLVLPTGQILITDQSNDIEVYTPVGKPQPGWAPRIDNAPLLVHAGASYKISGTQFNGVSQGAAYGDDAQMNTNFPLVRFTSLITGKVSYWKTHDHSTMGVATGSKLVSTYFDVPDTADLTIGTLSVVANGIPSNPWLIGGAPADRY